MTSCVVGFRSGARAFRPISYVVATTKTKQTRKPTSPVKRVVSKRPEPEDVFSAAGGVPTVPTGLPANDFSQRQSIRELGWGEFDRCVQQLARAANAKFKPQAVVGLVHGGVFVGGAIASALKVDFFPVRVTERSRETKRSARARDEMPKELEGRRVLIVDDVASSGDSIVFATKLARASGVKAVKSAALIARPGRFEPDFAAETSDDFFVFPWDYKDVVDDHRFDTGEHPIARPPR